MGLLSGFLICLELDLPLAFDSGLILELLLLDKSGLALDLFDFGKSAFLFFFCLLTEPFLHFRLGRGMRVSAGCGDSRGSGSRTGFGEGCCCYAITDVLGGIARLGRMLHDACNNGIVGGSDRYVERSGRTAEEGSRGTHDCVYCRMWRCTRAGSRESWSLRKTGIRARGVARG